MKEAEENTAWAGALLMVFCAICLCCGQFVWKYFEGFFPVILGFGIYGLGALAMMCAYQFGSLSVLQPINSLSYVISAVLGSIFFDETITIEKAIGIATIMLGVFFLAKGEAVER